MFQRLGELVTRHWWAIVLAWVVAVGLLRLVAPPWSQIARDGNLAYLPPSMSSVQGEALLHRAFPANTARSQMIVIVSRADEPLRAEDFAIANALEKRFLAESAALGVQDVWTHESAVIGKNLLSDDAHAMLVVLQLTNEFMATENMPILGQVQRIVAGVNEQPDFPPGLQLGITGSAAVGADMLLSAAESIRNTEITTIIMVIAILLAVYRAPLLVVVPLTTIIVSISVGTNLVGLLTQLHLLEGMQWWDFKVFTTTRIFIVVILFGAGTDFCLFLIARYKEELERGLPQREALSAALANVGHALVGSALTTILGLGMMFFADFGKFRDSGPAIAVCLSVMLLASLTLAPALLQATRSLVFWPSRLRFLAAGQGAGESRNVAHAIPRSVSNQFWWWASRRIMARPGVILLVSVLALSPLAIAGSSVDITYDLLGEMQPNRPSVMGSQLLRRHFSAGETGPVTIVVQRDGESLDSRDGRRAISLLTRELEETQGVIAVRSFSQPLGEPVSVAGFLAGRGSSIVAGKTQQAKSTFLSPVAELAGTVTRFDVVLDAEPFSHAAVELLNTLQANLTAVSADPGSAWHGAKFFFTGTTSGTRDLESVTASDQLRIQRLVVIAVLAVLLVLIRQPIVCLYLIVSVLFSYYVTMGATELLFSAMHGESFVGLDWKVPIFLFVILIAIGEDYNIYLMTRVDEEQRRHGAMLGLQLAVARTGGIITSCGVIMAATFLSMLSGTLRGMQELGFALSLGVLLDTLVVRPILVPAFLAILYRYRGNDHEGEI